MSAPKSPPSPLGTQTATHPRAVSGTRSRTQSGTPSPALSRTMRCTAVSHYYQPLADTLPPLDARLSAVTRERYRRIDRFVQLTLLGAAACARQATLARDCGLYLSSGVGPLGSNVLVQDAIHRDSRMPMPFSFVNTLGSSACYHVVKELDLTSEAVMVARGGASFSTALLCAYADLASGIVSQVLVGAVEECVLPPERHRALLRFDDDVAVAEGSHWLLLELDANDGRPVPHGVLANAEFDGYESADAAQLTSYIAANSATSFGVAVDGPHIVALVAFDVADGA